MKKTLLRPVLFSLLLLLCSPWTAQAAGNGKALDGLEAFDTAITNFITKWDVPGASLAVAKDGKVTKAEVDAFHAAQVKAADANGDGKLSADELATMQISAMTARITARAAKMVELMDTDKDGALSAAELAVPPGPEMMFDKIDANSDGAITQAEVDAAKQAMQQHMGGMDGEGMMGGGMMGDGDMMGGHGRGHGRGHHDGFWGWFGGDDDAAN